VNRCAEERPAVDSHPGDSQDETPGACNGRSRVQIPAGRLQAGHCDCSKNPQFLP